MITKAVYRSGIFLFAKTGQEFIGEVNRFSLLSFLVHNFFFEGFDSFKYGSNIIFSNGLLDPWHALGVLSSPNEKNGVIAVVIPESAHHGDLRGADKADPIYLTQAREKEASIINGWLEDFFNKN